MARRKAVDQGNGLARRGEDPHGQQSHHADLNARRREKLALELRMAGQDFDSIAQQCGYAGKQGAHAAYQRALRAIPAAAADEARRLECARMDALLTTYWPKAMGGDGWSCDRVLRISERRARLLGLDLAAESTPTAPVVFEITERLHTAIAGPSPAVAPAVAPPSPPVFADELATALALAQAEADREESESEWDA